MVIGVDLAEEILDDGIDDWETVPDTECIIEHDRWTSLNSKIVKEISSGRYFKLYWSEGLTENQDYVRPFPGDTVELQEMKQWRVVRYDWVPIDFMDVPGPLGEVSVTTNDSQMPPEFYKMMDNIRKSMGLPDLFIQPADNTAHT